MIGEQPSTTIDPQTAAVLVESSGIHQLSDGSTALLGERRHAEFGCGVIDIDAFACAQAEEEAFREGDVIGDLLEFG